ncbi:hypothetical protein [Streptomyces sp. NBC_00670]|uniref:hypothetical protein n=1 Tax=Streptomyces sp. NBC_00670 TaxID=2975804 RepID=UPI002E37E6D4|nr:hypothetical protein [Streptomyces sp. NBC_00670]
MTPFEEISRAAEALRAVRPVGATLTAAPAVAALLRAREPLATLLDAVIASNQEAAPAHEECNSWCSPEICDLSAALEVARALNHPRERP